MEMPGMPDLNSIKDELKAKFDEAGMGKVEEFTDKIDDIIAKTKEGPGEILEKAKASFEEFKGKIQGALDDPSSLAPGGGAIASCATWYGKSVAKKLGDINNESAKLVESVGQLPGQIQEPLNKMSNTLTEAMEKLEGSLKALGKLPKLVAEAVEGKSEPKDVATIDTAPMKKALDCKDVDGPLDSIVGLKDVLGSAVDVVMAAIEALKKFLQKGPDMVKSAFKVPVPLCCMTSCAMKQAPQIMNDLLDMLDKLKEINFQVVVDMLKNSMDTIKGLDVSMVKEPMGKFLESAGDLVDKLDKGVQGAKLATGGGMPGLSSIGGMFK